MVGGYNAVVAHSTQGQARAMFSILIVVFLKRLSQDSKKLFTFFEIKIHKTC